MTAYERARRVLDALDGTGRRRQDPAPRARTAVASDRSQRWRESAIVVARVIEGEGACGYNAATDQYADMVEMWVINPTKVTRLGLQNAASIVSLILTMDCVIVERPAPIPAAHGPDLDA